MEFQDFVRRCVSLFREAKKKKMISPRVTRGRAGSCSSACEDLIALAISEMIPNEYKLLVDYPLTVRHGNGQRAKTAYPDVAVLYNRTLAGVIEIKVDLGYLPEDWSKQSGGMFSQLQQATSLTYRTNVGTVNNEVISISPAKEMDRIVVVLSGLNDHGRLDAIKQANSVCFVLMPQHHPNSYYVDANNLEKFITAIADDPRGWDSLKRHLARRYQNQN